MNFKCFILFRKTLFVPGIRLRYNNYRQCQMDGGGDMANTTKLALEASLKELLRTKPIDKGMHEDYHKIVMTMGTALDGNIARSIGNFKQK